MPLTAWATHVLQWFGTEGSEAATRSQSLKTNPSSDCRLKPACMKMELLVIADQHAAVNAFPGLVHTARHTTRVGNTRSPCDNVKGQRPKVGLIIGVKS